MKLVLAKRRWLDLAFMLLYYVRFAIVYGPQIGAVGALKLYVLMRIVESHW